MRLHLLSTIIDDTLYYVAMEPATEETSVCRTYLTESHGNVLLSYLASGYLQYGMNVWPEGEHFNLSFDEAHVKKFGDKLDESNFVWREVEISLNDLAITHNTIRSVVARGKVLIGDTLCDADVIGYTYQDAVEMGAFMNTMKNPKLAVKIQKDGYKFQTFVLLNEIKDLEIIE